ncbi:MAG: hypothetical protein OSA97_04985 [Nevskia sp.]|nr:hypothetical protein [Nevskia sp.]
MTVLLSPNVGFAVGANESVATCAKQQSLFDDPSLIQHKYVSGAQKRLDLHPQHPSRCVSANAGGCRASAYIIPGDSVAVGSTCGAWAYVQYSGRSITRGWVESNRLTEAVPHPLLNRGIMPGEGEWPSQTQYRFALTEGYGQPVCDAYLKRLNASFFERPPYCGRPENDELRGFTALNRVPLANEDIQKLIAHVTDFMESQNQDAAVYDGQGHFVPDQWSLESVNLALDLHVWRYAPEVDIDNDGKPDKLIVWHGYGADLKNGVCGVFYPNVPGGARGHQVAYMLTADGARIDEARMHEIFEHPRRGYPVHDERGNPVLMSDFRPIGTSMSIFKYDGQYYFDTFFDGWGDFKDQRQGDAQLFDTLGVFLRKDDITRQVCEYTVESTIPRPQ